MKSIFAFILSLGVTLSVQAQAPKTDEYFTTLKLDAGITAVGLYLKDNPKDDNSRFALGAMQFVRSIERFGQGMYKHGLSGNNPLLREVPFLRLPLPENKKPEKISYAQSREIFKTLQADLTAAELTLSQITSDDVKLVLPVGSIKLDFTGTGQKGEPLSQLVERLMGARSIPADFTVAFDRGDATWLRGYCHLLLAITDFILAHDGKELFERAAHMVFPVIDSPYPTLNSPGNPQNGFSTETIVDAIAAVHLIRLPVVDKERMASSLKHLEKCLELSEQMWSQILAETDDDREWIPNPKQKGALGVPVNEPMITAWKEFTIEARQILAGKKLVPFWRYDSQGRAVNLRKVLTEPTTFDLVLWVQGSAAIPYLEKGQVTDPATWNRLLRVFEGRFFGMALWFN